MNVRNLAGISVLIGTIALTGNVWAADETGPSTTDVQSGSGASIDSEQALELHKLRTYEDSLDPLIQKVGPKNADVIDLQNTVSILQKRMLSRAELREVRANREALDINNEFLRAQQELRQKTGRVDVSPENLESAVESLEKDKEALMLADVAAKARRDAMEEAIAEQTTKADKTAATDATIDALRKGVEAREKQLDLLQQEVKSGLNTPDTVMTAQESLAEAEAKLAERRSALSGESGGNLSSALSRELLDLNIAEKEREAKMQFIEQRLKTLGDALQMAENADLADLMRRRESTGLVEENARHNLQAIKDEIEATEDAAPPASQPSR